MENWIRKRVSEVRGWMQETGSVAKNWIRNRASALRGWAKKTIFEFKNWVWKHRISLTLSAILLLQVPLVYIRIEIAGTAQRDWVIASVETGQVLVSSGLLLSLFSKKFESLLEHWLYGRFRRNWKEVRVMYSENNMGQGLGEEYPRDPTLLIQAPIFDDSKPGWPRRAPEDILLARSLDGKDSQITAGTVQGPMAVSFNTGQLRKLVAGEGVYVTGKWSALQLMRVNMWGRPESVVGFPDTLVTVGKAPTKS